MSGRLLSPGLAQLPKTDFRHRKNVSTMGKIRTLSNRADNFLKNNRSIVKNKNIVSVREVISAKKAVFPIIF